jgi:hypothetical protein
VLRPTAKRPEPLALELSKVNFEALAKRFQNSKDKNTYLEVLKTAVCSKLDMRLETTAPKPTLPRGLSI